MPDLLLELRSEEIPARMQRKAAGDLKRMVTDAMVEAGLAYEGAREYWTPRRLTLDIRGVDARSKDVREERKGPRTDAPDKAIEGFLRGAGLAGIEEAERRSDGKKGEIFVAVVERPGRTADAIVAEIVPRVVQDFPWPKSMRWGAASAEPGSLRWVRPLQSILCVFGPENGETVVVDFAVGGIRSGDRTVGHRFHAPEEFAVRRFDDYVRKLEAAHVVLDADRRRDIIRTDAEHLAFAQGLEIVPDEGLLEEVSGLVEWPVVLMGSFEESFLAIPAEMIQLTIRTNQKCFVCRRSGETGLSNRFVLVSNIEAADGGAEIARGNGKVVRARLSDALYFWQTDQADLPDVGALGEAGERFALDLGKPLDQRMAKLDALAVTFHAKLGTQGARVARIRDLAAALAPSLGADPAEVARAATLAKADLTTEAVGEFPELQGLMGRRYAALQGEGASVQAAIEDHYKPQGPGDRVPSDPVAIAVALADKLDTLMGFWAIDEKPTGSKDPYALRRAALGVIRIVLDNELRLPLDRFLASGDLLSFFHDRLKVQLRDAGARHDLVDAVLAGEGEGARRDDLLDIARRVAEFGRLLDSTDGVNLLAAYRRAANILAAEEKKGAVVPRMVAEALFQDEAEGALWQAIGEAEAALGTALKAENYAAAAAALARLREPADRFFERVLVNAPEDAVRLNRLALLSRIRAATAQLADFSRVAG